jgi:VWFA-related protein
MVDNLTPEAHPQPAPATIGRSGYRVGDGNTNLYEALEYVFTKFKANEDRIAVVVFSDGVDTVAGRSVNSIRRRADEIGKEVRRYAQESWALLYPIRYRTEQIIGEMPDPAWRPTRAAHIGSRPSDPGRKLFSEIASASGGEVFEWAAQGDLTVAIEGVLSDLRSQYGMAYTPPRSGNRTGFHHVKVKVKRTNMVTRARQGYLIVR